jgi:hypothetical protein
MRRRRQTETRVKLTEQLKERLATSQASGAFYFFLGKSALWMVTLKTLSL